MKKHVNECLRLPSGRIAGSGISYDDYTEEATLFKNTRWKKPIYTIEYIKDRKELKKEQPVTVYKLTKEEMDKYLKKLRDKQWLKNL